MMGSRRPGDGLPLNVFADLHKKNLSFLRAKTQIHKKKREASMSVPCVCESLLDFYILNTLQA